MAESSQSVLRCSLCSKPFDKDTTLKRHGYYCRSRRLGTTHRARSCISCVKSKTRCDNQQPQCSRCSVKAIACHYPTKRTNIAEAIPTPYDNSSIETNEITIPPPSLATSGRAPHLQGGGLSGVLTPEDCASLLSGEGRSFSNSTFEFGDFFAPQVGFTTSKLSSATMPDICSSISGLASSPVLSRPMSYNRRPLVHRSREQSGARRISSLIYHNLEAFPLMMLRNNALPPFIHPRLMTTDFENRMESLHNCVNLVHMMGKGAAGGRKLFWRNVRIECERMCESYLEYNKWEKLASMQALSIYLLIRLHEGETEHNNLEGLLIASVTLLAKQVCYDDLLNEVQPALQSALGSWDDWIYEESKRRLCLIYQIVNMLVYFEPAAMCDLQSDLVLAPLPTKKRFWEAPDEVTWKAERERESNIEDVFALAATGELVKLSEIVGTCNVLEQCKSTSGYKWPTTAADWGEWCSGMDSLGGLIMLAASLQS